MWSRASRWEPIAWSACLAGGGGRSAGVIGVAWVEAAGIAGLVEARLLATSLMLSRAARCSAALGSLGAGGCRRGTLRAVEWLLLRFLPAVRLPSPLLRRRLRCPLLCQPRLPPIIVEFVGGTCFSSYVLGRPCCLPPKVLVDVRWKRRLLLFFFRGQPPPCEDGCGFPRVSGDTRLACQPRLPAEA
jgi:hypothetical protein